MGENDKSFKTKDKIASTIVLGDLLLLQGRPSRVIKITPANETTGEFGFLGVDLLTKKLHEDTSKASTSTESEQIIQALDLETWRILDLSGGYATATDGADNVKTDVQINDENNLWDRLNKAFQGHNGKVFGLVFHDGDKDLIVELEAQKASEN